MTGIRSHASMNIISIAKLGENGAGTEGRIRRIGERGVLFITKGNKEFVLFNNGTE
jgi:hypothetical protein